MSYTNPLHPPVTSRNQSGYTSLHPPQHRQSSSRDRRRQIPQAPFAPSGKWHTAMARDPRVAQPIAFHYSGQRQPGVSMRELATRGQYGLEQILHNASEPVGTYMTGGQHHSISFKISWPGYTHVDWTRPINLSHEGKPLTRAQIAANIAQQFARFVEKTQYEATKEPQFMLGAANITFESLILLSLVNICDNIWMAEIAWDS